MGWEIKCNNDKCGETTWAANIVDLIREHLQDGWIICTKCKEKAYIAKTFEVQEKGQPWKPFLRGIIPLGDERDPFYQPFVFLVGYEKDGPVTDVWFSYYKDLRPEGRLKLGYGPGGPPVLDRPQILRLLKSTMDMKIIDAKDLKNLAET